MTNEKLANILEDIESGNVEEARKELRAFLTTAHDAPSYEVRYVLGRAWFEQDKATARYLFEESLALKSDYAEAGRFEARCGSSLEDLESFRDDRHPPCGVCGLNYRDHEPVCPYCGSSVTPQRDHQGGSIEEELRNAGKDVVDSIRSFTEREDVKQAREKVSHAGQQAYEKAREIADSEKARELKDKASKFGQRTAAKAKEIRERKEVQQAKARASALGKDAVDKAKTFGDREDVKQAVHQAKETSRNLFQKAQDFIKAEQQRINAAQGPDKAKLIGKWVLIALALLIALKFLFGGE